MTELIKGTPYQIRQIDPLNFSYTDALKIAEIQVRAFQDNAMMRFWQGTNYEFDGLDYIAQKFASADPRARLAEHVKRAKAYQSLVKSWAAFFKIYALNPGMVTYGVYNPQNTLVAFIQWQLQNTQRRQQLSLCGRIRSWCIKAYYKTWERVAYLFTADHPLNNTRIMEYWSHEKVLSAEIFSNNTNETMVGKTRDELIDPTLPYPEREQYLYLAFLGVSPEFQRQQIGKKLVLQTLAHIPHQDAQITFGDKTMMVPQKLYIKAAPAAHRLYTSLGFETLLYLDMPMAQLYLMQTLRENITPL